MTMNLLFWLVLLLTCMQSSGNMLEEDLLASYEDANKASQVGLMQRGPIFRGPKPKEEKLRKEGKQQLLCTNKTRYGCRKGLKISGDEIRLAQWCAERQKYDLCVKAIRKFCELFCRAKDILDAFQRFLQPIIPWVNLKNTSLSDWEPNDSFRCVPWCELEGNKCLAFKKNMQDIEKDGLNKNLIDVRGCENLNRPSTGLSRPYYG